MSLGDCLPAGAGGDIDDLIDEAQHWLHRDTERCAELLDRAESGLAGQRDVARVAWLHRLRGDLAVASGELGAAASAYRTARRHWLAAGEPAEAVRAAAGGLEVQLLVGEFAAAEAGLLRLQAELRALARHDLRVPRLGALVQRQLADARAGRGELGAALRQYDGAENLFAALGDVDSIARLQHRRGLAALDAGLTHSALLELDRSRRAYAAAGQPDRAAAVATRVAEAYSATGQVARALDVLDCVAPDVPHTQWHVALHALVRSGALLRAGCAAEAHAEACAAEEVFVRIGAVEHSARAALASARASLAWGRRRAAAAELEVADRLFGECGSRQMRLRTWLLRAEVARALGDLDGARAAADRVLAAEDADTPPAVAVHARLAAARVAEVDAATVLLDEADQRAAQAGSPELEVDVLLARARHERRTRQVAEAVETLRRALAAGRAWEQRLGPRGRVGCPSLTDAAEELILLLIERGDHAGRVEALRRARAAKRAPVRLPVADPARSAAPVERGRRLESLLADAVAVAAVVRPGEPVEEVLPSVPDGSLVEFYVAGDDIVVFVARDGHVDARVLTSATEGSRRLVRAWQQECLLMAPGCGVPAGHTSSAALDGLFDLLLAPVVDLLEDLDDRLQVVGHRHLHGVPFDALLDEVGPWYSHLARPGAPADPAGEPAAAAALGTLVIAVPDANAPSIADEAAMIRRVLPAAEVLVGPAATSAAVAGRSAGAEVVHFACHGVFRPDDPLGSGLRLADGWLRAGDVAAGAVPLDGAVVVLSACSSGRSPDHTAEEVGLVPACLAAGARGVVAALWAVDDEVTLELMTHFYDELAAGSEPAVALRRARRRVARRHPHPYHWAAFRYVGRS
ncbi:CHAT domain-containing protein [Nocardioides nitrophenolicus]|uniref:CHAT domain-containing protein n=1 Tax=Nocardioides nitrophenolicus TaxID=60489 RepID=UPI00195E82FE|nr:CHAT domain-containing protein [Nocardioides nitrophenolicus]MBM7515815.1 tetratricopeptide (TPR) repeat protein [Nocardioides nitrophenolicus]